MRLIIPADRDITRAGLAACSSLIESDGNRGTNSSSV